MRLGEAKSLPFYVSDSKMPIWQGELKNCRVLLGTNALVSLEFVATHSNGTVIEPTGDVKGEAVARVFYVVLAKDFHVGPFQARPTPVCIDGDTCAAMGGTVRGLVSPSEQPMAEL